MTTTHTTTGRGRATVRQTSMSYFVPRSAWRRMVVMSALVATVALPFYLSSSLWIGPALFVTLLVFWHIGAARNAVPWIPGVVVGVACVQWVLAPWAAYNLPTLPQSGMVVEPSEYFAFAVPSLLALALGAYLPNRRVGRKAISRDQRARVSYAHLIRPICEAMVFAGFAARILSLLGFGSSGTRYLLSLLGLLSYVGALALALLQVPGWPIRALVPFSMEALVSVRNGTFLDFVFWLTYFALVLAFRYRFRPSRLIPIGVLLAFLVVVFNSWKLYYRDSLNNLGVSSSERAGMTAGALYELIKAPDLLFAPQSLSYSVARLNQGYMMTRVLLWVPAREPFAKGETVITAVRSAILPRIIDAEKISAGGRGYAARFAGLQLNQGTSINLGIPGEMYANFGLLGGTAGVFCYGFLIGVVFAQFAKWSRRSQLWWAWAPFVLFSTLSAEGGLAEQLNQITKSALIMAAVVFVVPGWSALRKQLTARRSQPLTMAQGAA